MAMTPWAPLVLLTFPAAGCRTPSTADDRTGDSPAGIVASQTRSSRANSPQAGGSQAASSPVITIDPAERHQRMDGFGTCLVSWDAEMAAFYRRPGVAELYARYLGFNILRTSLYGDGTIGPVREPQQIRAEDPAFARTDPRTPIFLDFGRRLRQLQPKLRVIGSCWSPPAWMKVNGKITDAAAGAIDGTSYQVDRNGAKSDAVNRVKPDHFDHVAVWLAEFARYYERAGLPLEAISASNEPQFTQSFESCLWTAADLADVTARTHRELERRGLGRIRMFGPETMTGFNWENGPNVQYTRAMRANPSAWQALGMWATHGYADGVKGDISSNSSAQFWRLVAGDKRPYWVTEGGTGEHAWPDPVGEKGVATALHHAFVAGNASAFVPWQFAENSRTEHNLMPLEGPSKKTLAVRHFSRFIPAGSVRIGATPAYGDLLVSAYLAPDDLTVVLVNPGKQPRTARLRLKNLPISAPDVWTTDATRSFAKSAIKSAGRDMVVSVPGPGIVTVTTLRLPAEAHRVPTGFRIE
ncbi:MAG: glycoside hydrolase family 30 beta sandwich domain-containing protein [Fimbriimonadaceae bacterium]|nr:glycoside hydrolase family 30 beta sandwich domain-containing protein [Fimbriimonadaceae bacterium]